MSERTKEMGKYCKAYPLASLRRYKDWRENADEARPAENDDPATDPAGTIEPRKLCDEDYVYLQEDYVVTDGVFKNLNILFDAVTNEWKEFCNTELEFSIPDYVLDSVEPASTEPAPAAAQ